jgi:hypothetical protein
MPTPSTASIRQWAQGNGLAVASRGRLPAEVLAAYDKAHQRPAKADGRPKPKARAARKTASAAQAADSKAAESNSAGQADVVLVEQLVAVLARIEDLAARVEALERANQGKRRGLRFG